MSRENDVSGQGGTPVRVPKVQTMLAQFLHKITLFARSSAKQTWLEIASLSSPVLKQLDTNESTFHDVV